MPQDSLVVKAVQIVNDNVLVRFQIEASYHLPIQGSQMSEFLNNLSDIGQVSLFTGFLILVFLVAVCVRNYFFKEYSNRKKSKPYIVARRKSEPGHVFDGSHGSVDHCHSGDD